MMQLILVNSLSEHDFYVNCAEREMLMHLESCKNVHINEPPAEAEAFVNIAGSGFMYNRRIAAFYKLYEEIFARKKRLPKSAAVNCNIEKIRGRLSDFLTKRELRKYDFIEPRDSKSCEYIKTSCPKSIVVQNEDMVFAAVEQYKGSLGGCLGVSPVRRGGSPENFEYYRALAQCCDSFVEKYNEKVLLFAFDNGTENDASAVVTIIGMMKHREAAEAVLYDSEPEKFVKRFLECGRFAGSRFHSIVTALALGIPCVGVCDSEKLKRLCARFGAESVARPCTGGEIFAALERAEAKTLPKEVFESSKRQVEDLRDFLNSREVTA